MSQANKVPLFVLSRLLSSLWVSRTGSASDCCAQQEALYACIDSLQCNTTEYRKLTLYIVTQFNFLKPGGGESYRTKNNGFRLREEIIHEDKSQTAKMYGYEWGPFGKPN